MTPDLFCHIHVPKTGGTSLNLLLSCWFPGAFEVLHHPDPYHVLTIGALEQHLAAQPTLNCISTHHLKSFPDKVAGRKTHYFTILREPLDRTLSLLTFMKKYHKDFDEEHKRTLPANFDRLTDLEILQQWTEAAAEDRRAGGLGGNTMAAMFLPNGFRCDLTANLRASEMAVAARCIAVLGRFLHVGDFADFEASILVLAERIRALGASECSIDAIPSERISHDIRGDLGWLDDGAPVVNAYMNGLMIDGMVYRHFAQQHRKRRA